MEDSDFTVSSDHLTSPDQLFTPKGSKRKRIYGSNRYSILPTETSKWSRKRVERCLHILYSSDYCQDAKQLMQKFSGKVKELTDEQIKYIEFITKYLQFDPNLWLDGQTMRYNIKNKMKEIETEFGKVQELLRLDAKTPGNENIMWTLKLIEFLNGLRIFFRDLRVYGGKSQPYETFYRDFLVSFAQLCCLQVEICEKSRKAVWENLMETTICSVGHLRLYQKGLDLVFDFSPAPVAILQVKPASYFVSNGKSMETQKKRSRGSPSWSSSEEYVRSQSSCESADEGDSRKIALGIHDSILGQHAGELLLELHRIHKEDEIQNDENEKRKKLTMLGMIVDGTKVFFTMLEISRNHYQKLRQNENLDRDDEATVYYTLPRDIFSATFCKSLIEDFMILNNIEF